MLWYVKCEVWIGHVSTQQSALPVRCTMYEYSVPYSKLCKVERRPLVTPRLRDMHMNCSAFDVYLVIRGVGVDVYKNHEHVKHIFEDASRVQNNQMSNAGTEYQTSLT